MVWNIRTYLDGFGERKFEVTIYFSTDDFGSKLREIVTGFLRTRGWIYEGYDRSSDRIVVSQLPLNNKNTLCAYLRGISDGVSSYETEVEFWKRQLNAVYGLAAFRTEEDKQMNEKPHDEPEPVDIKKALDDAIKEQDCTLINNLPELIDQVNTNSRDLKQLIEDAHELEVSQSYMRTAVSALRQRTMRAEKKLDEKAIVINETVDKVSALQHKVDELEAYIKFIHPQYPFVLDDITGSKKKKGWFKR